MNTQNVEFLGSTVVSELCGDGRLDGVKVKNLKSGEISSLDVSALFVSIGRKPASALFKDAISIDERGYIIADESTETSCPGIFVAGDVRTKELRQVVTAVSDGATAAHKAIEYVNSLMLRGCRI